ncbi:LysE family translocator [Pseudarthrobacter sulfonivorans]|uniref:LysE family translocator n=1 Tax=Pseudarthrobacter sulfonivorans TaxID=121292 RepID=UPI0021031887|nr:LysE family translocator [Pseudarthrobacter sulfonivorans]
MNLTQALLSFAVVAGLLTLVPGIDTALVLRAAVARSRTYAFAAALGITTGLMAWGIAAAVGVSALLAASELAYRILSMAGAAYMVWLGASLLWKSRTKGLAAEGPAAVELPASSGRQFLRGWLTGTGTNLLNPKVGVFYIATIPQFIPAGTSPLLMGVLLAGMHCVLGLVWLSALIVGTGFASKWLKGRRSVQIIDRITGTALVGFGVKLALEPRL